MIRGIDCSRYQGTIDWTQVYTAGYRFAVIRATVGDYYSDPKLESNWDGAKTAGLKLGAYHVVRADNTPESQLLKLRGVLDGNDPRLVVLDCEVSPEGMSQPEIERAHYWMARKTREFYSQKGTEIWLYSAKWWWDPNIGNQDWGPTTIWQSRAKSRCLFENRTRASCGPSSNAPARSRAGTCPRERPRNPGQPGEDHSHLARP